FLTEDVCAKFEEWRQRGVRFHHPPQTQSEGAMSTSFEDADGNSFTLLAFDEMTREVEAQRRLHVERLESERRAAQEMELARDAQAGLFPRTQPTLATLEYAGVCIQARQVGGDYYDFLDLGRQRLGIILGDISAKGIAAALLMANLQASVRSQSAIAADQPKSFLESVNRLFYKNSVDSA